MPKAKSIPSDDISILWGQLLENVSSPPTRALLKQWANPVKITADETILTMKNEIFLNQVQNSSKKQAVIDAVDTMFSQSGSNVTIRLPLPYDVTVKAPPRQLSQPKPQPAAPLPQETVSDEEIEVAKQELQPKPVLKKVDTTGQSDMVKLIVDLFDGKVID